MHSNLHTVWRCSINTPFRKLTLALHLQLVLACMWHLFKPNISNTKTSYIFIEAKCIIYYNIVIHHIWAVLQSDWLNYWPYISSYTASSEKQDGGPKTTRVLRSRKKENIRFVKDKTNIFCPKTEHLNFKY
jgi:hypothetical protein